MYQRCAGRQQGCSGSGQHIHPFQPTVTSPVEWRLELVGQAKELGYPVTTAAEIEARFRAFFARLGGECERER